MSVDGLTLVGSLGSPYSRKMRALLRYRHVPFRWIVRGSPADRDLPKPRVALVPILVYRDGAEERAMIDSSPMIRWLEGRFLSRTVVHPDPALAFLDALVEDFADEWLTKAMFHYRWVYEPDIRKASRVLPLHRRLDISDEEVKERAREFAERQIGRLWVVGSNDTTLEVIEESYFRLLRILEARFREHRFVMGERPGACDFGLFGQLSQLVLFDPTSAAVAASAAPRVVAWTEAADDLSYLDVGDEDWASRDSWSADLHELLQEVGRVYAPFLLANAAALTRGQDRVECEITGKPWVQKPFPYQGKCLRWLREGYAALEPGDREFVEEVLEDTGCDALFSDAPF